MALTRNDVALTPAQQSTMRTDIGAASSADLLAATGPQLWTFGVERFFPESYGAVGDGATDDTAALKACVAAALAADGIVQLSKFYRCKEELVCYRWTTPESEPLGGGRRSIMIEGVSMHACGVVFEPSSSHAVLFRHAEKFCVSNFAVRRYAPGGVAPKDYSGVVFATPDNIQSWHSTFQRLRIIGHFRVGRYARFSMEDTHRDVFTEKCAAHFAFVNVNLSDWASGTSLFASPAGAWNFWEAGNVGWFHNTGTFDGVICEGGEVGFIGSPMQFNFVHMVCQGQKITDKSANIILPAGDAGTGWYLYGKSAADKLRGGNTFGTIYCEVTERPIYCKWADGLSISTAFFQGFWAGDTLVNSGTAAAAIVLDDAGLCNVGVLRTDGNFRHIVRASNNSHVAIAKLQGGDTWTANAQVNVSTEQAHGEKSTCAIGAFRRPRYQYTVANAAGATGHIPLCEIEPSGTYLINISGSINGTWIGAGTIVRLAGGVASSVMGSYATLTGNEMSITVRDMANAAAWSAATHGPRGLLCINRGASRFQANVSICVTQIGNNELASF